MKIQSILKVLLIVLFCTIVEQRSTAQNQDIKRSKVTSVKLEVGHKIDASNEDYIL